jgi:hypothetical protein
MIKELNRGLARTAVIGLAALTGLAWAAGETPSSSSDVAEMPDRPGMVQAEVPDNESATDSRGEQSGQFQRQVQAPPGSRIDLKPLPVTIYLMERQKPTIAFTTPCIMIEKATNGFPPFMAFENFMFEVIGNVNESDLLPIKIEPVCI